MKYLKLSATFLLGAFIIFGGVNHFLKPAMYAPFIPSFLPNDLSIWASGLLEIALGIAIFIPQYRQKAAFGIFLLMIAFLPLHIWDLFRETPAIGSHDMAIKRLPFQFVFIAWAWWLSRK